MHVQTYIDSLLMNPADEVIRVGKDVAVPVPAVPRTGVINGRSDDEVQHGAPDLVVNPFPIGIE